MKASTGRLPGTVAVAFLLLSAAMLAGPLAPRAAAALALRYEPPKASPGTVVSVETVRGSGILFREVGRRLFLAPVKIADEIRTLTDRRLSPIGELSFDEEGVGHLTFTVPEVAAGRYVAVVAPARGDRGAITAPEPFRVTAVDSESEPPSTGGGDDDLPIAVLVALVGAGVLLGGTVAALLALKRRRRVSPRG
jgi:hypothetical protein